MPIIKSAKKQMRQNLKKRARNYPFKSKLKTLFKKELQYINEGKLSEAVKMLPEVVSVIDTACKKNLIHSNNADRKKSRLARALNDLQKKGGVVSAESTEEAKK